MPAPLSQHPCFSAGAAGRIGRLHLAVAPDCNIQCNYCNRRYSCVNESRPGVTAEILKPAAVHSHICDHLHREPRIGIVGIAGPGDPLATPAMTLGVLRQVKKDFPQLALCLSTNGLTLVEHLDELAALGLEYLTITVNAVDPGIGRFIYSRVYADGSILKGREAAEYLLQRQLMALEQLQQLRITVKINTVVIPGINHHHVSAIARKMSDYRVAVMNCLPMIPVADTPFAAYQEISTPRLRETRLSAQVWLPQISHCRRCRADAAGLLTGNCSPKAIPA